MASSFGFLLTKTLGIPSLVKANETAFAEPPVPSISAFL